MWGIFDETGIFVALCQHGFVLLVADMVQSGELAKYPLAIVNALLDAFWADLGIGYDIGCGHSTTIRHSPLGPKAAQLNLKMLVGAFHGHAHNRKCQLDYLATYVLGLELEDLEGAEQLFSRSNGLSRSVRYASVFHRRQAIRTYFAYLDTFETYANLSTFLVNNYKQAIEILDTEESLKYAMEQAGVTEDMLKNSVALTAIVFIGEKFDEAFGEGSTANGNTRRHAHENYNKVVKAVQATERRLSIEVQWISEDKEWTDAAELVVNRRYRWAVDSLEALVVKRLLELTKVNQSGLGYKVRKHIAKALQVRSKAIQSALQHYNSAALALDPPRQHLSWEEDEREFLLAKEAEILPEDPTLAFFIGKYLRQRGRYDEIYTKCFYVIRQKLGNRFTADLTPGERADPTSASPSPETDVIPTISRQSHPASTASVSGAMDVDMDLASDNEGSENGWLDGDGSSDDNRGFAQSHPEPPGGSSGMRSWWQK
ncbi:hypothetical protein DFH08DRAFT_823197 [Mycena albidolilacea]|uniref:Uncharacterized protein n=1 Tax=Mycena albidolilacea TaxID=1033008 RepID=A0AAD6Z6R8_9AGAR|nr:hypothetical protein DFH08DRAFT_823197 [Mycena albidolilacea]